MQQLWSHSALFQVFAEFEQYTRMNVARRALIRSAGIRLFLRAPPHNVLSRPSSIVSKSTDLNLNKEVDSLVSPATIEATEGLTTPFEEDATNDDPDSTQYDPTLTAMRPVHSYTGIQRVAKQLGVDLNAKHYTIVMNNCVRLGRSVEAFRIYVKAKEAGIVPDARLVVPLLKALGQESTADSADRALEIYRELIDAHPISSMLDGSAGPNGRIYDRIFRILLFSPDNKKHVPIIFSLIEDMESRGLPADTNSVATIKIRIEMRQKRLFTEALPVYRENRSHLDAFGFFEVLQEYCRMSFVGSLDVPLITQYFSIVNDMRLQRIPISPEIYGLIVKHVTIMAGKLIKAGPKDHAAEALPRLVSTIRRVHDFLTLDASFSPTPMLLNQLMDAYQRLGCFGDAYRLWDMMYMSGRYDQITVNIMLDACGYADRVERARVILKKVARAGFRLDLRNWNTWVECLCRGGRFDEALNVAFVEIPKHGKEPNVVTVTLLDKFAKRNDLSRDFLHRVEKDFPQLWERLPEEIRKS
ncbi:hypothetical protein CVT25_005743 [Psilocybe cyanescens]|uniref:Pentacotripeptide-repeat region of PRORP domain-containing protein n=1 Tax=Psilocybe cyanescens TaxID=93625 RepID=A0A409VLJ9_PSICY|nr:hypothetical protein CVT25_005743 [Psilocybe cyanescens]